MSTTPEADFAVVEALTAEDVYAGSDVPGEFRPLTAALGADQLAITLIRVPPHSDFEQGTGHHHDELEELYVVTRGTLTMRLGDDVRRVSPRGHAGRAGGRPLAPQRRRAAGQARRAAPAVRRSGGPSP